MTHSAQAWLEHVFRPAVVVAMVGAAALSLAGVAAQILPVWHPALVVAFCVLAAAEAQGTHRLRARILYGPDAWRFRAVELALLYLALRLAIIVADGRRDVLAGLMRIDLETIAAAALVFGAWYTSTDSAGDLARLGEPPERDRTYVPPAERLTTRFLVGGGLLVVAAGFSRVAVTQVLDFSRAGVAGPIVNVLVYFLLGVLLLGQVHYDTLRRAWERQSVRVAAGVAGRWVRYSLTFLAVVAFIAFILPTSYTLGLLDTARYILGVLTIAVWFLAFIITLPFALLLSLFRGSPAKPGGAPAPPPPLPPAASHPGGGPDLVEIAKAVLFWLALLALVVYLARLYWRHRPPILGAIAGALAQIRVFRALGLLWGLLWRHLRGYATTVGGHLARALPRRATRPAAPRALPDLLRLRGLSPREQVLYYYLSVVRRAGRQGLPRRAAQTPAEYSATLASRLPDAGPDVADLTDAFVEARYGRHPVAPTDAGRARSRWQRVKAALQARRGRGA
ncbi:MAG TPA: DUF4129 domain-containing protein [Thermomicrobiales bacterium]|nr:DUF4129 domain-containing protein [Thermomicrobiales bacterium]